ncbi:MAG: NAD-dependent epimerase/dehydratase family protein [Chloroflexota bacterium]
MRVVIIGGSGHTGTYLVPRLVKAGYQVINVTRGKSQPYLPHPAWNSVQQVILDREVEEAAGRFGQHIRDLKPDIVIDMMCFTPESARQIVESLRGQIQHFLHCGTIWIYGYNTTVPTTEDQPRLPFHPDNLNGADPYQLSDYGPKKAAIEAYLLDEARRGGFPATCLHPGHIVGPGHYPVTPQGNGDIKVFEALARGEELALPNLGLETLHHVHGDDVAQAFMGAITNRSVSLGESFHVVSPAALTLRGYAEAVAEWFGKPARLKFMSWEIWGETVPESVAATTWDHISRSPSASIAKAQRLLNYQPRYTSLQAIFEALQWMIAHQIIRIE